MQVSRKPWSSAIGPILQNRAHRRARCNTVMAALFLLLANSTGAEAKTFQEMFPDVSFRNENAQRLADGFNYKQGTVSLPSIGVNLNVPVEFYFFDRQDSKRLLTEVWGNPSEAAEGVLGMILPADKTPLDDTWGAVITFDNDGYISDDNAAEIDYSELLGSMQAATQEANRERTKAGYPSIRLVGWASPPFYDRTSHKLHWAKELEFGGQTKHTLNYNVRALGRRGVLAINFVADIDQLAAIRRIIPTVMAVPEFQDGWRYADYVPGADKVAAYGIGGLITGKVLAKSGFLVLLFAFLKKGWILVVLLIAGIGRWLGGLFGRSAKTEA